MISKNEILERATEANLLPNVIEKDYVLGWLLAGINHHPTLRDTWVFKGGTCLKKCYFETYRFSEDLDFTLCNANHVNPDFLRGVFTEIAGWVYERTGIEIPADRLKFEIFQNPHGVDACQGRIYYGGPVGFGSKHSMPKIKLDLSADEVLVDAPVMTPVRHDYSDYPEDGINIQSYSYAEVFAEKIRALKERTRPRDLYDVVNFFRRPESGDVAPQVKAVLAKKCIFKNITFPTLDDLDSHKSQCATGWKDQLSHQLQTLPPFDSFWSELPAFFSWLEHPDRIPATILPAIAALQEGEVIATGTPHHSMLDRVRFAAVNRLRVEMVYRNESGQQTTCLIEPYSLRITAEGNLVMYAVELSTAEVHSFRTDRFISAKIVEQAFLPRYSIDFIPEGPVSFNA
jgi:predicted nucleotidyltransferase component of viral defense system